MRRFIELLKILPLGVALPIGLGAAAVSPDDAASNLSKWAHWIGIHDVPAWLAAQRADRWFIFGLIALSAVYAYFLWREPIRKRLKRLFGKRHTPQPPTVLPAPSSTEHPFLAPNDAELEIVMEREEFHPFQYKAILLEAKVRIRNKSTKIKYPRAQRWEMRMPEGSPDSHFTDIDVQREVAALGDKRNKLARQIAPLETITGWSVVALPHQPSGGVGAYTLTIEDEVGTQYVLHKERHGSRLGDAAKVPTYRNLCEVYFYLRDKSEWSAAFNREHPGKQVELLLLQRFNALPKMATLRCGDEKMAPAHMSKFHNFIG
jgi:hypothetical protein